MSKSDIMSILSKGEILYDRKCQYYYKMNWDGNGIQTRKHSENWYDSDISMDEIFSHYEEVVKGCDYPLNFDEAMDTIVNEKKLLISEYADAFFWEWRKYELTIANNGVIINGNGTSAEITEKLYNSKWRIWTAESD